MIIMSEIVVIDLINRNSSHSSFNNYFLNSLCIKYDRVKLIANSSHIDKLELENLRLQKNPVNEISRIWFIQLIFLFFKLFRNYKDEKIVILAQDNYFTPLLFILFFPFYKNKEQIIFFHNNLENLLIKKKRIIFQLYLKIYQPKIICLTKTAYFKTKNLFSLTEVYYIQHPHYKVEKNLDTKNLVDFNEQKINIIVLGRQAKLFVQHNLPSISQHNFKHLLFHVFIEDFNLVKKIKNIQLYPYRPNKKQFAYLFSHADYTFFNNKNSQYRASGLLMDSISFKCPIIGPKTGHFHEIANDNIGVHYNDEEELIFRLDEIDDCQIHRSYYSTEKFNRVLQRTNFENICDKFFKLLEN